MRFMSPNINVRLILADNFLRLKDAPNGRWRKRRLRSSGKSNLLKTSRALNEELQQKVQGGSSLK